MRPNEWVPGRKGRRGIIGSSGLLAISALLVLVVACGGSSASGGGGGGGGDGSATLTVSPNQAKPGQVLTVRGARLPKGTADPVVRGDLVMETPNGEIALAPVNILNQNFSQTAFVPEELTPGEYTMKLKLKGEHAGKDFSAKVTVIP